MYIYIYTYTYICLSITYSYVIYMYMYQHCPALGPCPRTVTQQNQEYVRTIYKQLETTLYRFSNCCDCGIIVYHTTSRHNISSYVIKHL